MYKKFHLLIPFISTCKYLYKVLTLYRGPGLISEQLLITRGRTSKETVHYHIYEIHIRNRQCSILLQQKYYVNKGLKD